MDILAKLKASRSATKPVALPGTEIAFLVRVCTCAELQAATFETEEYFRQRKADPNSMSLARTYSHEETLRILSMALLDPVGKKPAFRDAAEARIALSDDQRDYLAAAYAELEEEISPRHDGLDEAKLLELAEEVKKNPNMHLNFLSSLTLTKLVRILAAPPATSQTGNGTTSS